jgi:hypothetical protein
MDIDRFWALIDEARAAAGTDADEALRDPVDETPEWDLDDLLPGDDRSTGPADERPAWARPDARDDWASGDGARWDGRPVQPSPGETPPAQWDGPPGADFDDEPLDDIADPLARALTRVLAHLQPAEIAAFEVFFDHVRAEAVSPELRRAAELIEPGSRKDEAWFDDFRAGLVALGRPAFEAAVRDPDSLADQPLVQQIARAAERHRLGREDLLYSAARAYSEATGQDEVTFFDAVDAIDPAALDLAATEPSAADQTASLPRLTRLFHRS